tara:strand:+ start:90 stop:248 length:159 start_codon:yes stop_codon:yes gene_type:complete
MKEAPGLVPVCIASAINRGQRSFIDFKEQLSLVIEARSRDAKCHSSGGQTNR